MGDTGPCGPCSEIHYDLIGGRDASFLVNNDDSTVIEIWNLVFITYNRDIEKKLTPLPAKHIDTGMGFERMTCILQDKKSNYDTDIFQTVFSKIQELSGIREYRGQLGETDENNIDMSYRVVADHVRTASFAICDGASPGKEGRGYVVRRILRRAIRYAKQNLNTPTLTSRLVPTIVEQLKEAFPELEEKQQKIISVIEREEKIFLDLLDSGTVILNHRLSNLKKKNKDTLEGEELFLLHTTHGFPADLTLLMCEEKGFKADMNGYKGLRKKEQDDARLRARKRAMLMKLEASQSVDLWNKYHVNPTDSEPKYERNPITSSIKAIWDGKQFLDYISEELDDQSEAKQVKIYALIVDRTNFYAEQGGQIYDTGLIQSTNNDGEFEVQDVQVFGGYCLHMGILDSGSFKVGDSVSLQIDNLRRGPIMSNHTLTHILNLAIRKVTKENADQKGSLVDEEKLRFDFGYDAALTNKELQEIEDICNDMIKQELDVFRKPVPLSKASQIHGLRAVFGEVYPDPVTIVCIGKEINQVLQDPKNEEWANYSIEFCGGTHLKNTKEAKLFVIISEAGIAQGVRRIIAWTGSQAEKAHKTLGDFRQRLKVVTSQTGEQLLKGLSELNQELAIVSLPAVQRPSLTQEINELVAAKQNLRKNLAQEAALCAQKIIDKFQGNNNCEVIVEEISLGSDQKALSSATKLINDKCGEAALMIFSPDSKKINFLCTVPKSKSKQLNAGEWAKEIATKCGGKGGGKDIAARGSGDLLKYNTNLHRIALEYAMKKLTL